SVQKIMTIGALDMVRNGHRVTIFVPLFPWYYYFVSLRKRPLLWLRFLLPNLLNMVIQRKSHFKELLKKDKSADKLVKVKFVLTKASKRQLEKFDYLLMSSIDNVIGYQYRFNQERQIYILHHPEEQNHGYAEVFKLARQSFAGKIITISPFTAREIEDHADSPFVVPNPISPYLWEIRDKLDSTKQRRDVILYCKGTPWDSEGAAIIEELIKLRSNTSVTVWFHGFYEKSAV
ncbi:uncharacterized protein METZ01_LOCUS506327, partial [marine metagenome]